MKGRRRKWKRAHCIAFPDNAILTSPFVLGKDINAHSVDQRTLAYVSYITFRNAKIYSCMLEGFA
jgi:hypothetical protein